MSIPLLLDYWFSMVSTGLMSRCWWLLVLCGIHWVDTSSGGVLVLKGIHWVDTFAGGLIVLDGIIHSVVSASAWFIKYIYLLN